MRNSDNKKRECKNSLSFSHFNLKPNYVQESDVQIYNYFLIPNKKGRKIYPRLSCT